MTPDDENAGVPRAGAPDEAEAAAWAEVLARWEDEGRHLAYLSRFGDLAGLAIAGRRYRGILAKRPGDEVALRFREEILRRATAQGLAAVPLEGPARGRAARARRAVAVAAALLLAAALLALAAGGAR